MARPQIRSPPLKVLPMPLSISGQVIDLQTSLAAADAAALAIPPVWPLASSVAVNPFLGQSGDSLANTAALLARVAGSAVTMPRTWYHDRIASGTITDADLCDALEAAHLAEYPLTLRDLKTPAQPKECSPGPCPTIADLAAGVSGIDWPAIIAERFGAWAAGYLDEGQALWGTARSKSAFMAWRATATHDLTPEIAGLNGFAKFVAGAPDTATDAISGAGVMLALQQEAAQTYFHRLLVTLGGWAHYARYQLWQARLAGREDGTILDFLAIRLVWEEALFEQYRDQLSDAWRDAMARYAQPLVPTHVQVIDTVLQAASERASQRVLDDKLRAVSAPVAAHPPLLQAAFCIDVRSEVFRRALEAVAPRVRTLGFAGFFGLATAHRVFASDVTEMRLPVLLSPGLNSHAGGPGIDNADHAARFKARASRAWGRFKLAAVSSFAFVEATGPVYVTKLIRDALGIEGQGRGIEPAPSLEPSLTLASRVATATAVLRAMSLTDGFAPLVLLIGHGASAVNNPHASALHCGACGGYPGDVNARLLATLLNDLEVRDGLAEAGIRIPLVTRFLGALHDTTTDEVTLFDEHGASADNTAVAQAAQWLADAGTRARAERALRLPRARGGRDLARRSRDWSEIRPEWGLAGCSSFIAAPRARTADADLGGRAFLHDYNWRTDSGFGVLELIITAPVVVASWISLQYYGSTVAPAMFGGGNKLLHNVVGGIGVLEGNGGALRAGLPWQSVQDGRDLVHEPLRLAVCIEAPTEAITAVLARHPNVRALFDNKWLHLFALDDAPGLRLRYVGDLTWQPVAENGQSSALAA